MRLPKKGMKGNYWFGLPKQDDHVLFKNVGHGSSSYIYYKYLQSDLYHKYNKTYICSEHI